MNDHQPRSPAPITSPDHQPRSPAPITSPDHQQAVEAGKAVTKALRVLRRLHERMAPLHDGYPDHEGVYAQWDEAFRRYQEAYLTWERVIG